MPKNIILESSIILFAAITTVKLISDQRREEKRIYNNIREKLELE
jgi:hypothetical protein